MNNIQSEQIRTGQPALPNYSNPVTSARKKMLNEINQVAAENDSSIEDVSLNYVKQYLPDIQRYVVSKGEQPLRNPVELCVQAMGLNQIEAKKVAHKLGCDIQDAQIFMDENEAKNYTSGGSDFFLGSILGAVSNVAQKGIQKIAAKRNAKGKPNKFWNWLAETTKPQEKDYGMSQPKIGEGLKIAARDVLDDIREGEKNKEIKKMLPFILVGLAAVILITVLITSNAAKSK